MLSSRNSGSLRFGPFEVDAAAEELLRGENRIRLSGQPFQILLMLLHCPGAVVTREQLRERLWSDGTFVDFEHGLNAAINKLRRALGDAAEDPRYIETIPGRGYRFIGVVQGEPEVAASEPTTSIASDARASLALASRPRRTRWLTWVGIGTACALSFGLGKTALHRGETVKSQEPTWKLTRLTAPGGFSDTPALSRDGRLVAYSSDPGGKGHRDIYVRQVAGGRPIQVTTDGEGNTAPDFSPDSSRIVFESSHDGGGIYITRTFGGNVRLLARNGRTPKYSPDGSLIAFWSGDPGVSEAVPGDGTVWIIDSAGGAPRRLAGNLTNTRYPIWAPDGRHLLAVGYDGAHVYQSSELDWWLLPTDGKDAARTGLATALAGAHLAAFNPSVPKLTLPRLPRPGCWTSDSNRVVFSIENSDANSLWSTVMSPQTGNVTGAFERLTTGAGSEVEPSCTLASAIVFTDWDARDDVWLAPADLNRGVVSGAPTQVTQGLGVREYAELSKDGGLLAYASSQEGPLNIWLKDLHTGTETHVAESPNGQRYPMVNFAGKVAFSMFEASGRAVYIATDEAPQKICDACLRNTGWSPDGTSFLTFSGNPYEIELVDMATKKTTTVLRQPRYNLIYGRFSPDARWITFTMRTQPGRSQIMIAPFGGPLPVPESAWIKIADASEQDWANWSPDGKTIYFTSARDGHYCLWGQRLDAKTHAPVGQPFVLLHLHGVPEYAQGGWSAAGSRVAMVLLGGSRDVWMMSR